MSNPRLVDRNGDTTDLTQISMIYVPLASSCY